MTRIPEQGMLDSRRSEIGGPLDANQTDQHYRTTSRRDSSRIVERLANCASRRSLGGSVR